MELIQIMKITNANQQAFTRDQVRLLWQAAFTLEANDWNFFQGYAFESDEFDPDQDLSLQKCIKVTDKYKEEDRMQSIEKKIVDKLNAELKHVQADFQIDRLPSFAIVDLSKSKFSKLNLKMRIFHLPVDFTGSTFSATCDFSYSYFRSDVFFDQCLFLEKPNFCRSYYLKTVKFDNAKFKKGANFSNTVSKQKISFKNCHFEGNEVFFELASYHSASFMGAVFDCKARFKCSSFLDLSCKKTTFNGVVSFQSSSFIHNADFSGAVFNSIAKFDILSETQIYSYLSKLVQHKTTSDKKDFINSKLSGIGKTLARIDFSGCVFNDTLIFNSRSLSDYVTFTASVFYKVPRFYKVENVENLDFTNCKISYPYYKPEGRPIVALIAWLAKLNTDVTIINDIRNLRRIASDTKHHDLSKDLFLLERCAEIGCLYSAETRIKRWLKTFFSKNFLLYGLYIYSSNGGRSIVLPFIWMLTCWFLFAVAYMSIAGKSITLNAFKKFAIYSYGNIVPFVSKTDWIRNLQDALFTIQQRNVIHIISSVENILGILLVFLLGLSIRNHFKIT